MQSNVTLNNSLLHGGPSRRHERSSHIDGARGVDGGVTGGLVSTGGTHPIG